MLKLILAVPKSGVFAMSAAFTTAPDYGVFSVAVEGQPVKDVLDLYSSKVHHTGELSCGSVKLKQGDNRLEITILDKNQESSDFLFGLDWIKLVPVDSKITR